MKLADVHTLHASDFYRILDFKCHCTFCNVSTPEYNDSFAISFIRNGFFEYQTFRRNEEVHIGRLLLSKPGFEHTTRHIDNQPDIVTIFDFKRSFFEENILELYGEKLHWVLKNRDIHSLMINSTPELEYLHHRIFKKLVSKKYNSLEVDELTINLLGKVMMILANAESPEIIPDRLKQHHLVTIETATNYILSHFKENVSLQQLATHCLVSPFHFSRTFKTITTLSPHQYLSKVRLAHAKVLLTETQLPVSDIAYDCGFNSPEHFVTAFKQYFKINPSFLRKQLI